MSLLVIAVVIGADYALVGPWFLREQWLRLGLVLAVAFGLQRALGPAALPLGWGNARASMRLVGKVVLVGVGVCIVVGLGSLAAARLGGLRWGLAAANFKHPEHYGPWLVVAVLWAPLIEEVVYRGIVQARLRQLTGRWVAIGVSGLAFWIYHWVGSGHVTSPHHLGAGLLLAWSYERTRSLLAPTVLHAVGNLVLGTVDLVYLLWPQWVHAVLGWS